MNVEQLDGFLSSLIAGPETVMAKMPGAARGPCLRVSSMLLNVIQRDPGICFSHEQERDQFPKVDRAFFFWVCGIGVLLLAILFAHYVYHILVKRVDVEGPVPHRSRCRRGRKGEHARRD